MASVGPFPAATTKGVTPVELVVVGHCAASAMSMQTGPPQHVSTTQTSPSGHSKFTPHTASGAHRVLPGTQMPPPCGNPGVPGAMAAQMQSSLLLAHGMNVAHVAPLHSSCCGAPGSHSQVAGLYTSSGWHVTQRFSVAQQFCPSEQHVVPQQLCPSEQQPVPQHLVRPPGQQCSGSPGQIRAGFASQPAHRLTAWAMVSCAALLLHLPRAGPGGKTVLQK
jgi:hypothetical protein